jgi:hypothetical protein
MFKILSQLYAFPIMLNLAGKSHIILKYWQKPIIIAGL